MSVAGVLEADARQVGLAAPEISEEDRERVHEALGEPTIAYGETVKKFELDVREKLNFDHAVATISGTSALHLGLLAVGVKPGDLVPMPSLTFVAPAHAVCYVGADPLLFDVEPDYRQLDVGRFGAWLAEECEEAQGGAVHRWTGRRIGAVLPVDLLGHPCDVEALKRVTEPLDIPIVEDAAQSLGAKLNGHPLGGHADALCLSFNANKMITTGGGGMLLSDDEKLIERARFLASQAKADEVEYVHTDVGFNYRMPTAQAALGLSQLARLDDFLAEKKRIASLYSEALGAVPGLTMPRQAPWAEATNWLFTIHVDAEEFGLDSRALMGALKERGIESRPVFSPLHAAGAHKGKHAHECRVAEALGATGLSIPSSVTLDEEEQAYVIESIVAIRSGLQKGTTR